ncbi:MAG: OmpA family protein [Spirochaetales bacterium]|uniref:OmpA family protein n=1 Tax=Candidatus Thalassospirochaeta sargassi TaxID=3119039 RepID=A0AAJ1IBM9_9SPIO|nr:OmpA family protein [Spirochaetales bacterium]
MRKRVVLLISFTLLSILTLYSETFKFSYEPDDRYRILSRVDEYVYINGVYSHRADIMNKITVYVKSVEDGAGMIESGFQTSERTSGSSGAYQWATEYESEFIRDEYGKYQIEPQYFMPVVRDVPVFPDRDLEPGDTWSWKGEEVHDFRKNFGISDAYHIPIYVNYTYLGKGEYEGYEFDKISVKYNIFFRPSEVPYGAELYPVRISGSSDQIIYWDSSAGRPHIYEESFEFVFELSTGDTVEYRGISDAYIVESPKMDKKAVAEDIRKIIDDEGLNDTDVSISEEGVKITLSNIQFSPNSSRLLNSELEKLDQISEIISEYPERDILVAGHTALAGTAAGRQQLSEQRAKVVADYLLKKGGRLPEQIIMKGMGAEQPVADNSTEEGMRKNRRVEIIILEN